MANDAEHERYLERRAEQLGLPTDPEAYRDGGLGVAATALTVDQAELLACMLRTAHVPAWVEGRAMAGWNWHMELGLFPGGIRILVPTGRLAEARALLEEHRRKKESDDAAAAPAKAAPPADESEEEDPGYPLYRRARGLAYLLLIGIIAPVVFVLALRLLVQIRRERKRSGPSRDLIKAWRVALAVALLALPTTGVFVVIGAAVIGAVG
jgi:hypothetical protein